MNPGDVVWGSTTMVAGRAQARDTRANDTRAVRYYVEHVPTGIRVEGEIPAGRYSRPELKRRQHELRAALLPDLEKKVMERLRDAGRGEG